MTKRLLRGALPHRGRQLDQDLAVGCPQLIAPRRQPVGIRQIGQQVPAVQVGRRPQARPRQRGCRACGGRSLELQHVDVDRAGGVQHDLFVPDRQQPVGGGAGSGECAAGHVEGLVQVSGGGGRLQVGPEPVQDLVTVAALAGRQGEHRHQGLGLPQPPLPGLDRDPVDGHGERPEQLDAQPGMGRLHGPPLFTPGALLSS